MNFENMSKEELIEYINNLNEEQSGKYGLVWDAEKVPEQVVVGCNKLIPVLKEEENKAKLAGIRGKVGDNGWGSQIRNYVLQPYTMVKDARTGFECSNAQSVLDGGIDGFISAYLKWIRKDPNDE